MAGIWKKMRSENGESLTELLLSVLIVSLGLSMFATALLFSKKMLELGEAKVNSYYTGRNALEQEQEELRTDGSLFISGRETSGPAGDGRFGERIGSAADGNDGSYRIILYHAGTGHTEIWRYDDAAAR